MSNEVRRIVTSMFSSLVSLVRRERNLGPDHPDFAENLDNQAGRYFEGGNSAQAEPLLQRFLAIREKALGPEHAHVAKGSTLRRRCSGKQTVRPRL